MKKKRTEKIKPEKENLWLWTRAIFQTNILFFFLGFFIPATMVAFDILYAVSLTAGFVLSILHVKKYDKKALGITSLVLTSYLFISMIVGFILSLFGFAYF